MMMVLHVNVKYTMSKSNNLMNNFTVELVFGFRPSKYEVHEDDGSVMIEVIFIQGIPGNYQPAVLISTHNGTAKGQQVFYKINAVL